MRASSLLSRDATWNDCNSPGVSYTSEPLGNRFSSFTTPRCSGAHAARFIKANLEISFSLFIGARVGSPGAVELRVNTGFNSHASPGAFRCYGCTEVNLYTALPRVVPGRCDASGPPSPGPPYSLLRRLISELFPEFCAPTTKTSLPTSRSCASCEA
jgi:hypothetical protein